MNTILFKILFKKITKTLPKFEWLEKKDLGITLLRLDNKIQVTLILDVFQLNWILREK